MSPFASSNLSVSAGASSWSGDYGGSSDTSITAALVTARYGYRGLRLDATLPYMRIDSAGAVFAGIEGTPVIASPSAGGPRHVHEGLGDLTLGASYQFASADLLGVDLEASGRIKVPTSPVSSGVSTGQVDTAWGLEASRIVGPLVPFASVSYRTFGDTPQWRLRDGAAASIGASYLPTRNLVLNISYDYARSASRFVRDSDEIVGSFSTRLTSSGLRLTGFLSGGLSSGAAAVSGGASLSVKL